MGYTPMYLCDLHTHTTCSDGHDTPKELIDRAISVGMKIIAITDHDRIPVESVIENGNKISIVEYAADKGLKLIRGIEISCDTSNEDVHIIGLGCDWKDAYFKSLEREIQKSRAVSYKALIAVLNKKGIDITWDEVLKVNNNVNHPELIQKKHIYELMASKGYTESWQEAKLFIQNDLSLKSTRKKPDPIEVIDEIHRTGGIAILAHPYLIEDRVSYKGYTRSRDQYIKGLIEGSLDGIEACYTYDKTSYKGSMENKEIEKEIRQKYAGKVAIISGGSDYHGDYKKHIVNARELGECGIDLDYFYGNALLNKLY
ncbi:PHP domain-containing protein [Cellulosilyticum sp. I15G10I2]|uniref:PHP domain-containing protein n=1 Tax=Cellulosilyticum sp. I15G10I2 TaxID=1892843 RepID=UPI00085BC322|nr:PHP domain-containing protein [Cellulosilyticum sp. I15G10I2]